MPVPWISLGGLVLSNLDKIMAVVKPAFTRRKIDAPANQPDLLNQQIAELQVAASANAEQIRALAAQFKDVVAVIDQAAAAAAAHRVMTRRLAYVATGLSVIALVVATLGAMN